MSGFTVTPEDITTVAGLTAQAGNMEVNSHDQCQRASDLRKQANDRRLDLDKRRKAAKQPHLEAGRQVDSAAAVLLDPLKAAIKQLDEKQAAYANRVEAERAKAAAEEAKRLAQAHAAADGSGLPADLAGVVAASESQDAAPIRTRKVTRLEIVDKSLIPDEFLLVDEVAVRAALLRGEDVPGARLVEQRKMA